MSTDPLAPARKAWQQYLTAAHHHGVQVDSEQALQQHLLTVWSYSPFIAQSCIHDPGILATLLQQGLLERVYSATEMQQATEKACCSCSAQPALETALRRNRTLQMVRIAWRDLSGQAGLEETLGDLSVLAEASVQQAIAYLYLWACRDWGTPRSQIGQAQGLVVLSMGKLGAGELNFSSDIDLIFTFPQAGLTDGKAPIDNEQFFTRLCRNLIRTLDTPLAEGFVFRVDTRLRPYGESGPLVLSFAAMEDYYQEQARDWERYAMVKARPIAGEPKASQELMAMLKPFVYRRYLDYGTFQALREMKRAIQQALRRKGAADNIKLGIGGIREIEFIGQAFQLIRGGREPALQERSILKVLEHLGAKGYLSTQEVVELRQAYIYLRRVENHLQAYADRQVHTLPTDPEVRQVLGRSMGEADWEAFLTQLDHHRTRVQAHFERVFANEEPNQDSQLVDLCRGQLDPEQATEWLQAHGLANPKEILRHLAGLRTGHAYRRLAARGQDRLDQLLPLLLVEAATSKAGTQGLIRLLDFLEHILQRTAYLALLIENPMALTQLVRLAGASPWVMRLLARHPILLDELLDPRTLYAPPRRDALQQDLRQLLSNVAQNDLENAMETLRYFAQSQQLRIAAADVTGALPVMVVSDYLTELAEVVLGEILPFAWNDLAARYGSPSCLTKQGQHYPGFAIIGYGKLGGIELGYGSDLDLVFLHNSCGDKQQTCGPKVITNAVFFTRLGQRILHILNTFTPSGRLYEVDMRLRPSGNAGPLATSIDHFREYQISKAWTWEHQALVRARFIAGVPEMAKDFAKIRCQTLAKVREPAVLQKEVREMRQRMWTTLGNKQIDLFNIKQDRGGIADIEFLVQFEVLRWAYYCPDLLEHSDNIRILQALTAHNYIAQVDAEWLITAYQQLRNTVHRATLQEQPALVEVSPFRALRARVQLLWSETIEKSLLK